MLFLSQIPTKEALAETTLHTHWNCLFMIEFTNVVFWVLFFFIAIFWLPYYISKDKATCSSAKAI